LTREADLSDAKMGGFVSGVIRKSVRVFRFKMKEGRQRVKRRRMERKLQFGDGWAKGWMQIRLLGPANWTICDL